MLELFAELSSPEVRLPARAERPTARRRHHQRIRRSAVTSDAFRASAYVDCRTVGKSCLATHAKGYYAVWPPLENQKKNEPGTTFQGEINRTKAEAQVDVLLALIQLRFQQNEGKSTRTLAWIGIALSLCAVAATIVAAYIKP